MREGPFLALNRPTRRGSASISLLPKLLDQPAVNVTYVVDTTGVALSAAQRAVNQLEKAGIISWSGGGRRNRTRLATEVIAALDAFAGRVGRRGRGVRR